MPATIGLPNLLTRRRSAFVLWRPRQTQPPPRLVLGRFQAGNPPSLADEVVHDLALVQGIPDLWSRFAADCGLMDGEVYHYWFEVTDSRPGGAGVRLRRTDPAATTVDWRLLSPPLPPP
jgi:pullulanase